MKFTLAKIEKWATNSNLIRGQGYFKSGKVKHIMLVNERLARGIVKGRQHNRVFLKMAGDNIRGFCSCSYASSGLCKHQVAVFVALSTQDQNADRTSWPSPKVKFYTWLNCGWIYSRKVISFLNTK